MGDMVTVQVPADEWVQHRKRVDLMTTLLGGILEAAAQHPIFSAMIPGELLTELRTLNADIPDYMTPGG